MLINVYVNGDWDTSLETQKEVVIFNRGIIYQMDEKLFDSFIDELEKEGYDCYFCPELFKHPDWNGIIKYDILLLDNFAEKNRKIIL